MISKIKKTVAFFLVALCLLAAIGAFLHYKKNHPSTDDAYIHANIVSIAAEVNGGIISLPVHNHQTVQQGQLLLQIDPKPYQLAVQQASAQLNTIKGQIKADEEAVKAAKAIVQTRKAQLTLTQKQSKRVIQLVQKKLAAPSEGDNATSKLKVAQSALTAAQSQLAEAEQRLGLIGDRNSQIQAAMARLKQAQLNLSRTRIIAPSSGTIENLTLRIGSMITAQQPLFSIVDTHEWWVDANFKETQLEKIHVGQPATIVVDMYPNHHFKGIVESISRGSNSSFSLFPAENATGNWVKVTQRFAVRINMTNPNQSDYPLRIGASCDVSIDTTHPLKKIPS